jgi:hypothetical protein
MPTQIKALLKPMIVYSSDGITDPNSGSVKYYTEVTPSVCYVTIPSIIEVAPSINSDPYVNEGTPIPYITTNASAIRPFADGGYPAYYWTRSPSIGYQHYVYAIHGQHGWVQAAGLATNYWGVLVEISF